mgnify:FL=1|jgi:hypothetical protein|tara:strand:- start:150 stop:602 length:453 start_codon:yes stop_codon:yes gene_type:complete
MSIFDQKLVTENEDTTSPEHYLWISVLSKAAHDAIYGSDWREAKLAISWFKNMGAGFREVCEYAGRNPYYIHKKMEKPIQEREQHMNMVKNGPRLYVEETRQLPKQHRSHYRGTCRKGKPPQRWRCGNQKKDPTMVLRGSKGGRPKLYVV